MRFTGMDPNITIPVIIIVLGVIAASWLVSSRWFMFGETADARSVASESMTMPEAVPSR